MASVRQRGDLQWEVRVRRKGNKPAFATFEKKVDADNWGRDTESAMVKGTYVDLSEANKLTLADACDRFQKQFTVLKKGAVQEKSKLKGLKASFLGPLPMGRIKAAHVVQYRDGRLRTKDTQADLFRVGPATVIKELNLISRIFKVAATEWRIEGLVNPMKDVSRPPAPKNRQRIFRDQAEMDWVIDASESVELKLIIPLAVNSAMRRSEMVSALRANVNLLPGKYLLLEDTKNGIARKVPLNAANRAMIEALPTREDGRLFSLQPNSVTQAFTRAVVRARKRYIERCEVEGSAVDPKYLTDLKLHDTRHEATTRIVKKFKNPLEAMAITGHSDYRSIKGYYHPDATDLAERMDD